MLERQGRAAPSFRSRGSFNPHPPGVRQRSRLLSLKHCTPNRGGGKTPKPQTKIRTLLRPRQAIPLQPPGTTPPPRYRSPKPFKSLSLYPPTSPALGNGIAGHRAPPARQRCPARPGCCRGAGAPRRPPKLSGGPGSAARPPPGGAVREPGQPVPQPVRLPRGPARRLRASLPPPYLRRRRAQPRRRLGPARVCPRPAPMAGPRAAGAACCCPLGSAELPSPQRGAAAAAGAAPPPRGRAPPRAPLLSHGGRAPPGSAGRTGRSLPRSLPLSAPRVRAQGGDAEPAGGRQSSGPARLCRRRRVCGAGAAPARSAAGLRRGRAPGAGRGGRAGSRPRPPAAETFGGVRGVGSGRELRAAARCGCGRSPRGERNAVPLPGHTCGPAPGAGRAVWAAFIQCARLMLPAPQHHAVLCLSAPLPACSSSEVVRGLLVEIPTCAFAWLMDSSEVKYSCVFLLYTL